MAYSTALLAQTLHLHCPWSSPPHTSAIQPLTCRPCAEARQQNDSVFSEFQVPLHLKFKLEPDTGLRVQEGTKQSKVGSGQSCRPRALHSPQRGGQRHFCVPHCPAAPCEVKGHLPFRAHGIEDRSHQATAQGVLQEGPCGSAGGQLRRLTRWAFRYSRGQNTNRRDPLATISSLGAVQSSAGTSQQNELSTATR